MADIVEVENFAGELKVIFSDGVKEEIEGGFFERKNANGDTVEERPATQADTDRLTGLAAGFEQTLGPIDAAVVKIEREGASVEIYYADGSKEELEGGKYEREAPGDVDLIERAATADDIARFDALIDDFVTGGGVIEIEREDDFRERRGSRDDDEIRGGGDDDLIQCGRGDDDAKGRGGDDKIVGARGDDSLAGGGGEDELLGGRGKDKLNGGAGGDDLMGGGGADNIRGGRGNDTIEGGDGADRIRGEGGDDVVSGGAGNDRVRGDHGDDMVFGGAGQDRVRGDAGSDYIDGGTGSDRYWGGAGADTFVFGVDGSFDKIHDFQDGLDLIDLSAFNLSGLEAVTSAARQDGFDVVIDLGGGDVLKIDETSVAQLTADDFVF